MTEEKGLAREFYSRFGFELIGTGNSLQLRDIIYFLHDFEHAGSGEVPVPKTGLAIDFVNSEEFPKVRELLRGAKGFLESNNLHAEIQPDPESGEDVLIAHHERGKLGGLVEAFKGKNHEKFGELAGYPKGVVSAFAQGGEYEPFVSYSVPSQPSELVRRDISFRNEMLKKGFGELHLVLTKSRKRVEPRRPP